MIVSFISSNRQKFAAISADPVSGGLMMSNLIHSTYQRIREPVSNKIEITDIERYGTKLLEPMAKMGLDDGEICDGYEERARDYIETIKATPERTPGLRLSVQPTQYLQLLTCWLELIIRIFDVV